MNSRQLLAVAAVSAAFASPAMAANNSLTFQGVTFNTTIIDSDTLQLDILNALNATGDWTGVQYLAAFEMKNVGTITGASISPSMTVVAHPLSASGIGCAGSGAEPNGRCFAGLTALTNSMSWTIDFTGTPNFALPHLKLQFLTGAHDTHKTGSLLSLDIPAVPEPETYAMFLAGLGMMGAVARRRAKGI